MKAFEPAIVISEETISGLALHLKQAREDGCLLFGITYLHEGIFQVCGFGTPPLHSEYESLGRWGSELDDWSEKELREGECVLVLKKGQSGVEAKGYLFHKGRLVPAGVKCFSHEVDILTRASAILDTDALFEKTVCFVGLGSMGSTAALWLAESGLGGFKLFDPKRLSPANVSRHICDLDDLFRYKAMAVKDKILRRNPRARVQTFELDICAIDEEELKEFVAGSHLIIATTDYGPAQFAANILSVELGIPALFMGCYERACGGEIIFSIPEKSGLSAVYGQTPCYECVVGFRKQYFRPLPEEERPVAYSEVEDADQIKAEPGLNIDMSYVVAVGLPYALALLDRDSSRKILLNPEHNLIFVGSGNAPQWEFSQPFDFFVGRASINPDCPTCGTGQYFANLTGRSEDEVKQANTAALESIFVGEQDS